MLKGEKVILRTNYRTWVKERWFGCFIIGHLKDIVEHLYIFINILALILAVPYLAVEGLIRFCLWCCNKYKVSK